MCCPSAYREFAVALQVLHARTCSKTARQLIQFFAACHLIFSAGCDNVLLALDSLPPLDARPVQQNLFSQQQQQQPGDRGMIKLPSARG